MTQRVEDWIKSEWSFVMKDIGVQDLPQPERVLTYPWYFITKNGGKPMNDNYSTTEGNASERLSDSRQLAFQWKSINWKKAEIEVNRLQARIVKAVQQNKWNDVK